MNLDEFVEVDPEKMGGTPCFTGTRVPIKNLLDYLEGGDSLEEFLDQFPTVKREQAQGVLELSSKKLLADALRRNLESHSAELTESFIQERCRLGVERPSVMPL